MTEALQSAVLETMHDRAFRDPAEVLACWQSARDVKPELLEFRVNGRWWEVLGELGITLFVSREYEHLLLALRMDDETGPDISMMRLPHPSGIAVNRESGVVHVAATRNPNQIFDLMPVQGRIPRLDVETDLTENRFLVPVQSRFLPGCLYVHDLAIIGGVLHANAVGENAIIEISPTGSRRVWWPKCIETPHGPVFGQNHLQLNSIAAGDTVPNSFFSASTDEITERRPGNPDFPVDRRGVIISGDTREPIARGLTRPHSARMHVGKIWVDNSGYGELGFIEESRFQTVSRLPGWTRGLCFCDEIAFVGISKVLSRFTNYAPGLDPAVALCGVHAVNIQTGETVGSIVWPFGSQIFAVEWLPSDFTTGFPFRPFKPLSEKEERLLFYSFRTSGTQED
ncbi:DUF4915 domain-containing protein [Desulfomonile tiedjei]|uniref:Conserved hypothetical protein CHP03032 domain-containing protein n=1 Tax=Desulfomonile tiedjei (strain ATCC 49306 / DSM 6799 / DCB-1) TaxID=706587 RepID=I4C001_DESTA|nr:DUF4915 domain-containing protein [Desulfomonile tiedjei]AFM22892.1 hypothetical protein Desti_0146 [Desulfomonile tiedjei DSM 6799]